MEPRNITPHMPHSTALVPDIPEVVDASDELDPIHAARAELMRAEAQFSEDVKRASTVGGKLVYRAWTDAKPLLITVAVGATVGIVAIAYVSARHWRRKEAVIALAPLPARPSLLRNLALAAFGTVAKLMARRLAARLAQSYQR